MKWIGTVGGVVLAITLGTQPNLGTPERTVPELEARLVQENNKRDTLQTQLEVIKPSLEKARSELKKLTGKKRDARRAEALKERIEVMERSKLRILSQLLKVQEQRAELLTDIQSSKRAEAEAIDIELTPEEQLAAKKTRDDALRDAEQSSKKRAANMDTFRKEIATLTTEQKSLKKEQRKTYEKRLTAEKLLTKAKLFGKEGEVAFHQRELDVWVATQEQTDKRLRDVRRKLMVVQKEFERYVEGEEGKTVILPGETVEIYVAEERTLNGLYTVRRGGYIVMPKVGKISLAGLSLGDAEATVKRALELSQLAKATVLLERPEKPDAAALLKGEEKKDAPTIYLTGAFKNPGPWKIPQGFEPTLVTAIIRSGGAAKDADLEHVRVMRILGGKGLNEEINVRSVLDGRNVAADIKLRPEDIVIIPTKRQVAATFVFVTGLVKTPGPVTLDPKKPMTAHAAILRAGGFTSAANISKIFILRDYGSGRKSQIPVDIKKIRRGAVRDPKLRADDIIVVPGGIWSK